MIINGVNNDNSYNTDVANKRINTTKMNVILIGVCCSRLLVVNYHQRRMSVVEEHHQQVHEEEAEDEDLLVQLVPAVTNSSNNPIAVQPFLVLPDANLTLI